MSEHDAFATAAHLHVLLRRKTGRVTDTEWMATNADYALAMVKFARDKADSDALPELLPLAERLEALAQHFHQPARRTLLQMGAEQLQSVRTSTGRSSGFGDTDRGMVGGGDGRYVGRLR